MEECSTLVPMRMTDFDSGKPKEFSTFIIPEADKKILRELAKEKAEIAFLPIHNEKIRMWKNLNSLSAERPMVWVCDIPWHEIDVNDELRNITTTEFSQFLETRLRRSIYQWKHMPGDMVVEAVIPCYYIIDDPGFGFTGEKKILKSDENSDISSKRYIPLFKTDADIEKIKFLDIEYDETGTENMYQSMKDLFDGILKVEKTALPEVPFSPMDQLIQWYGVQETLTDLLLKPDFIHKILEKLTSACIYKLDQYENKNLLSLNNKNYRIGSSGLSFSDELPQKDRISGKVRTIDMWGASATQSFSDVSPEMHEEFALDYEIRYLKRYGLNYYGCCEPLENKIEIIKKIPRLRKISMSPWVDLERGADGIGRDYVFSWKPNPAVFAVQTWDSDFVREDFRNNLNKIKNCSVELIMKDISTVRYEPQRLWEWVRIAQEEVERLN